MDRYSILLVQRQVWWCGLGACARVCMFSHSMDSDSIPVSPYEMLNRGFM